MKLTSAVVVFAPDLRRILLIRRDGEPFKGLLGLPGGTLETGETFFDAARRELREEAGITASSWAMAGAFHVADVLMVVFATRVGDPGIRVRAGLWYEVSELGSLDLAPNVAAAAIAAREVVSRGAVFPLVRDASTTARRVGQLVLSSLQTTVRKDGRLDRGWDHYLQRRRTGTIGTALGLLTLGRVGAKLSRADNEAVIATLLGRENEGGGWGVRGMEAAGSPSLVESTCYVLDALRISGFFISDPPVQRGLDWILRSRHGNGGWGTIAGLPPRILPTTLAMCTLAEWEDRSFSDPLAAATRWLLRVRNEDGGWGVRPSRPGIAAERSTAPHTSRALTALVRCEVPRKSREIVDAQEWLLRQAPSGWKEVSEMEYLGTQEEDEHRLEFRHTADGPALCALLDSGVSPAHPVLLDCMRRLMHAGSQGTGVDETPMWAAFDQVRALSQYVDSCLERDLPQVDDRASEPDATVSTVSRFYQQRLLDLGRQPEPTREQLVSGIRKAASHLSLLMKILCAVLFAGAITWISPRVFQQWDVYEPILYLASLAIYGLLLILGWQFTADRWRNWFDARIERHLVDYLVGAESARLLTELLVPETMGGEPPRRE